MNYICKEFLKKNRYNILIMQINEVVKAMHEYITNGKILEQSQCARKIVEKNGFEYILAINGMECDSL